MLKGILLIIIGVAILVLCDVFWDWYDGWWQRRHEDDFPPMTGE